MVKAAYSSGTPAIGVGAGNGPAYIDHTADIPKAVRLIIDSKTFDNGTICASEQSIVVEEAVADEVEAEFTRQGACFLTEEDADRLSKFLLRPNGTMNPAVVGHSVEQITKLAGLANVPSGARLLVAREHRVGLEIPYSREKLCPVIAYYVEKNADTALTKVQDILHVEGVGHSFCIHSTDEQQMRRFALAVPASRIILNGMGALGGIGATTNLFPALTLGCGNVGGSSSSNNIGPLDLINIRRAARGTKQLDELCAQAASVSQEKTQKDGYGQHKTNDVDDHRACGTLTPQQIDHIVERILKEIM
jgi:acyl-CoA reductase-like NAD-dependent aldehyde dehydrogenase